MMHYLIKEIPIDERPREKMLKQGPRYLSNSELIAIILKTGIKGESVLEIANRLLFSINDLSELENISIEELVLIKGIGKVKALEIKASIELSKRILTFSKEKLAFHSPKDVYLYLKNTLIKDQEQIICLYLDTKGFLKQKKTVFIGSLAETPIHPREIFKWAVKYSAIGIIIVHNHPSGDPTPSKEDLEVTRQIVDCGKMMKIEIFDHIIIGKDYYSFKEHKHF